MRLVASAASGSHAVFGFDVRDCRVPVVTSGSDSTFGFKVRGCRGRSAFSTDVDFDELAGWSLMSSLGCCLAAAGGLFVFVF